jgi:hypothetical protein
MRKSPALVALSALTLALETGSAMASPQVGDTFTRQFACSSTSHFRVSDGAGGYTPFSVSNSFLLTVVFTYQGTNTTGRRRGYDYYQAQSQMNSAGLSTNPLFQGSNSNTDNPLFRSSAVIVRPVNDPPLLNGRAGGLYIPVWSDASGHFDLWDGMDLRVRFQDALGNPTAEYVSEGGLTLTGDRTGGGLDPSGSIMFSFKAGGDVPIKWMAPESLGRLPGDPPLPELWLDEVTLTTEVVPTPGATALLGTGLLLAGRRRRR